MARSPSRHQGLLAAHLLIMKIALACFILGLPQSSGSSSSRKLAWEQDRVQGRVPRETTDASKTGMRASLVRRLVSCSETAASIPGDNSTASVESRQEKFRCDAYRSKARLKYLISKNLPSKIITKDEQKNQSAAQNGSSPVLKSNSKLDSSSDDNYYSDSWASSGEYVMSYELGTPAKSYIGIADTGSDLTWMQCKPCFNCYSEPDPYYNPSSSSTYEKVYCGSEICRELSSSFCNYYHDSCDYFYAYGDTSHTFGSLSTDTITFNSTEGNSTGFDDFIFGCGHDNTGSFGSVDADGIVGLGQGSVSLPSQLGGYFSNKFSYCLISRAEGRDQASDIYFGEVAVPSGDDVQYTPILTNQYYSTYYYVNFTGISMGGTMLNISYEALAINEHDGSGGMIFDSGTTYTQLVTEAYNAVIEAFESEVDYPQVDTGSGLLCYDVTGISDPTFPNMTFYFTGVHLDLPQDNYFINYGNSNTKCLALGSSTDLAIFGNVQQQNFHILYDRENSKMAFKATECDAEE